MRIIQIIFLLKFTIIYGQGDNPCSKKIYQISDTIPELISSGQKIVEIIASQIKIPDSLVNRKGRIDIQYVINCNGKNVRFKVLTIYDYDKKPMRNDFSFLGSQIILVLRKDLKWTPARQGGKNVDFLEILAVQFGEGYLGVNLRGNWYLAPTKD